LPAAAPTVPFSRILKLKIEWGAVSREFQKNYSGTGPGPVPETGSQIVIAARTLLGCVAGAFSGAGESPLPINDISRSQTSREPEPTT
jgi:hypothetical protein